MTVMIFYKQKFQKTSTTETQSCQSKGYQNRFMQINCRLNLSLQSVQGGKKKKKESISRSLKKGKRRIECVQHTFI